MIRELGVCSMRASSCAVWASSEAVRRTRAKWRAPAPGSDA